MGARIFIETEKADYEALAEVLEHYAAASKRVADVLQENPHRSDGFKNTIDGLVSVAKILQSVLEPRANGL